MRNHAQTGLSRFRASHVLVGVVAVPLAYYAYAETYRYYILRRRKSSHKAILSSTSSTSQAIIESIRARFASLQCLLTGRYLNVTDEWREPGFWEFFIHQLVRPFTGRLWWNGGLPADPRISSASLPVEEPDFVLIRRHSWRSSVLPHSTQTTSSSSSTTTTTQAQKESGNTRSASPMSEEEWEKLDDSRLSLASVPPTESLSFSSLPSPSPSSNLPETIKHSYEEMTATWFGQSTILVQMGGITFLTDPVFSPQPVESILAPTRLRPTPCSLERLIQLNVVDYVLISHNHYDHLDIDVLKALSNKVKWIIPKGLKKFFTSSKNGGINEENVIEMHWWQESKVTSPMGDIEVACTPAQHWSGRTPLDTNKSLWCGFVVKHTSTGKSFFHAGDTGYSKDLYKSIGQVYGPIELGLIPIGSFSPRWVMSRVHTDPQGSVSIHTDLQIKKSIGVHWGTWIMSDERYDDPVKELEMVKRERGIKEGEFVTLPVGRTFVV
ncbi:Metallo-hydrolase/oxidoreductase [Cystobasidium minutum MCA 4210]|uniref:Metallo-hydrolase/oxidoreductase n=1 Tax=Cystobasidium minutum MCA 4210 TaxID=1397322 RepID=UPI0034CE64CC|eukprot:jgi/Rhomi1/30728/CE30727_555